MTDRKRRAFGSVRKEKRGGRWLARYTGPDGKRRTEGTYGTERQAERALARVSARIDDGLWTPPEAAEAEALPTFAEAAEDYLTRRPTPLKPRTEAHYRNLLDKHILPALGEVPVDKLTRDQVEAWYFALDPSRVTLRAHCYGLARSIMGRAVKRHDLPRNVVDIDRATVKKRAHKPVVLTPGELDALAGHMPERFRALVMLAAWCSLRFGEAAELRRGDIDLEGGVVHVRRGVVRVNGQTITGTPKTAAGVRDVAIPPHVLPVVRRHLAEHVAAAADSLLFPATQRDDRGKERNLNPSTLAKHFYPAREAIGRPSLRFHDLRHTGLTFAAQAGATLADLKARGGHTTTDAVMIYQGVAAGRDAVIAAAMADLASKPAEAQADDLAAMLDALTPEDRERLRALLEG